MAIARATILAVRLPCRLSQIRVILEFNPVWFHETADLVFTRQLPFIWHSSLKELKIVYLWQFRSCVLKMLRLDLYIWFILLCLLSCHTVMCMMYKIHHTDSFLSLLCSPDFSKDSRYDLISARLFNLHNTAVPWEIIFLTFLFCLTHIFYDVRFC